MSRFFLGVDVGATKTHALLADEAGRAVGFGQSGPGNHEVAGYEGLSCALQDAVSRALDRAGVRSSAIAGAGFGIAGYDWPSERQATLQAVSTLGLDGPVEVVNDTLIGLLAGAAEGWGVAVVAGTGCNCWGWDRARRTAQLTGHGWWMGEGAGASELVWYAQCAVARAWSRRGPDTSLTRAFAERCGASGADDLLEGLCQGRYCLAADAAPLVFRAAAQGDGVAQEAIRWAGRELGSLAAGVIRQLGIEALGFDVVLVGSLYDGEPPVIEPMRQVVQTAAPLARLVRLAAPPVAGGVLLGMEQAGLRTAHLRETVLESAAIACTAIS
ncbi:MAG TPA: BadF/BadG/BcrA/BcrD ATPase family protein [Anaerolineae bacterium]|nr:BadF/BadG/BcrA/BcrD ATPase family protein [Anaerolineae bacterium]